MTERLFLTGDRSLSPLGAIAAVVLALDSLAYEVGALPPLATGDQKTGIEAAVRYLFPDADVYTTGATADGKPDFDDRHKRALTYCSRAMVIHPDPLVSSVFASAARVWSDDALTVVAL